jgi:hypothetical protein
MSEEQVANPEIDEAKVSTHKGTPTTASESPPDPAPQCAGCHRRGIELTLLENGKRYCERCAQEVERLMGIGPLFPGVNGDAGEPVDQDSLDELLDAAAEAELASVAASSEPAPSAAADENEEPAITPPQVTASATTAAVARPDAAQPEAAPDSSDVAATAVSTVEPAGEDSATLGEAVAEAVVEAVEVPEEPAAATDVTPVAPIVTETVQTAPTDGVSPESEYASAAKISTLIARANHEAAESASSLIPKPKATRVNESEEPPVMERVQEQTRPVRIEASASAVAPPPSDLLGALSAERARLLDQRELLEARFRAETEAIDQRLTHVESLLGDQQESIAS